MRGSGQAVRYGGQGAVDDKQVLHPDGRQIRQAQRQPLDEHGWQVHRYPLPPEQGLGHREVHDAADDSAGDAYGFGDGMRGRSRNAASPPIPIGANLQCFGVMFNVFLRLAMRVED